MSKLLEIVLLDSFGVASVLTSVKIKLSLLRTEMMRTALQVTSPNLFFLNLELLT